MKVHESSKLIKKMPEEAGRSKLKKQVGSGVGCALPQRKARSSILSEGRWTG